jgi:DMSO reductase anchor subunit
VSLYFMQRIYRIPARPFWNHWQVLTSFYASMLTLGPILAALVFAPLLASQGLPYAEVLRWLAVPVLAGLLLESVGLYRHAGHLRDGVGEAQAAWLEQITTFGKTYFTRNLLLAAAAVLLAAAALGGLSGVTGLVLWGTAALVILGTAIIGRALFYVLVIPTTMPGAFFWKNPGFQHHARDIGLARMPQVGVQVATH